MGTQLLSGSQDWNPSLPGFSQSLRDGRTQLGTLTVVYVPDRGTLFTPPPSLSAMRVA